MNIVTLTPILKALSSIEANPFQEAAYVAKQARLYTEQCTVGILSAAECADLLKDLTWDQSLATTALEQESLVALSTVLTQLVACVSFIPLI